MMIYALTGGGAGCRVSIDDRPGEVYALIPLEDGSA
jgi:hypothetical protein